MKLLPSIATLLVLFFISACTLASEEFNVEERFQNPAKLPPSILSILTKETGHAEIAACQEMKPHDILEVKIVNLNKSAKAFLVKPAHKCLCSANDCPMWMFQIKGHVTKLIWSTPATSTLEVMDKRLNGYSKLKEVLTGPSHGHEKIWSWNDKDYSEIYASVWTWSPEQNCRLIEETSQLVDGKMVQLTKKCPVN